MLTILATAFVLGLILSAAPGPVFAETVRRGINSGFRPALAVQLGSVISDMLWAVLGLAGIGLLLQLDVLNLPVGIASVVYLLWLAWDAWRAADRAFVVNANKAETAMYPALRSGIVLGITNPQNIAYWAALGSALGTIGVQHPTAADYATFFVGFISGTLAWAVICAALVDRFLRYTGLRWTRLTYRACAFAFLALALSSFRELWISHFGPTVARKPAVHGQP